MKRRRSLAPDGAVRVRWRVMLHNVQAWLATKVVKPLSPSYSSPSSSRNSGWRDRSGLWKVVALRLALAVTLLAVLFLVARRQGWHDLATTGIVGLRPSLLPLEQKLAQYSSPIAFFVMSGRHNEERRMLFRKYHQMDNFFFIVEGRPCMVPPALREGHHCREKEGAHGVGVAAAVRARKQINWEAALEPLEESFQVERAEYGDVVEMEMVQAYALLPLKLKLMCAFAVQRLPSVQWLVKVDDDVYVYPERMRKYLDDLKLIPGPHDFAVVTHVFAGWPVLRTGKWAELELKREVYPFFPTGCGYALTQKVFSWVAQHKDKLHDYQGEDTSLGVWLDNSGKCVTWFNTENIRKNLDCVNHPHALIVGHNMPESYMRKCANMAP